MGYVPFRTLILDVAALSGLGDDAGALDLLLEHESADARAKPAFWIWKGTLLWRLGRIAEAEAAYREGLDLDWGPWGQPEIEAYLGQLLLSLGRHEESVAITRRGAAHGDLECMYCGFRAMLALGKVEEVEGAIRAAAAADGAGVEGQLVLLEALLDLEGRRSEATRRTEARQTLDRLGNMQRSGVAFDAEQDRRLAALASRFEGPFGFFVRRG